LGTGVDERTARGVARHPHVDDPHGERDDLGALHHRAGLADHAGFHLVERHDRVAGERGGGRRERRERRERRGGEDGGREAGGPAPHPRRTVNQVSRSPSRARTSAPLICTERPAVVVTRTARTRGETPRARISTRATGPPTPRSVPRRAGENRGGSDHTWYGEMRSCGSGTLTRYGRATEPGQAICTPSVRPPEVEWK